MKWTLVQHSAYGYGNDRQFKAALETRMVRTGAQQEVVRRHGGLLFDSYGEAEDAAFEAQYPGNYEGLIPHAEGSFTRNYMVDGLRLYVPPTSTPDEPSTSETLQLRVQHIKQKQAG